MLFPFGYGQCLRHLNNPVLNLHNRCIALVTTVSLIPLGPMRITHSDSKHLVVLSDAEAATLVEASALLVVASGVDRYVKKKSSPQPGFDSLES